MVGTDRIVEDNEMVDDTNDGSISKTFMTYMISFHISHITDK